MNHRSATHSISRSGLLLALAAAGCLMSGGPVHAQREIRAGSARTSVNHNVAANRNVAVNQNIAANRNVNINQNVNVNRNVNVDRHVGVVGGSAVVAPPVVVGRPVVVDNYHPVATAAAVTAGVALTAAAVGTIVHSLPPSCSITTINGATYQNCNGTWYQPQYVGTQVNYVVVSPPR